MSDATTPAPKPRERIRLYRTEGIVLRRRDLGEADRLLTLYTEDHGKLRAIAKGVRRTRSRLAGHLEPFARTSLMLAKGRELDIVTQAELREPYRGLREDETRIAYASYLADLLDALTVDEQENRAVYALLVSALDLLSQGADPFVTARYYEIHLLSILGYRPELQKCVTCGRTLDPVENGFSPSAGGVLCHECRTGDPQGRGLSVNALKFLRVLERGELETAYRLRLGPELRSEVEQILIGYARHLLERDLASLAVLRMLAHERE